MIDIRTDILEAANSSLRATSSPGAHFTGEQRVTLAEAARTGEVSGELQSFAHRLYADPGSITAEDVAEVDDHGHVPVVETIGVVARLAAVDRFHQVVGLGIQPLPDPIDGPATNDHRTDLKKRAAHVPMPPGPIPVALDLVPSEGDAARAMFGPFYMTEEEMADPHFGRTPGLNTPQLETVASRISLHNRCFY